MIANVLNQKELQSDGKTCPEIISILQPLNPVFCSVSAVDKLPPAEGPCDWSM